MDDAEDILRDLEHASARVGGAATSHLGYATAAVLLIAGYIVLRGRSGSTAASTSVPPDYLGQVPVYSAGSFGAPADVTGSADLSALLAAQNAQFAAQQHSMFGGTPKIGISGGTITGISSGGSMTVGAVYHRDASGNWIPGASAPSAPAAISTPALASTPPMATSSGAGAVFGRPKPVGFGRIYG